MLKSLNNPQRRGTMEHEFKKKMERAEMVAFLRKLADDVERRGDVTSLEKRKLKLRNPVFIVDFEYSDKDYGRKINIEIEMKDYD